MADFREGMPGLFLALTADTSVASGAVVPFGHEDWSEQWPTWAAGVATIPRTGTYMVTSRWARTQPAAATTTTMSLRLNGGDTEAAVRYPSSNGDIRGGTHTLLRAVAGDLVALYCVTGNASASTFVANRCNLRIIRVGPERWT